MTENADFFSIFNSQNGLLHLVDSSCKTADFSGRGVLVHNTLGLSLVDLAGSIAESSLSSVLIASSDSSVYLLNRSLNTAADHFVACSVLLICNYSFLCRFDICQFLHLPTS